MKSKVPELIPRALLFGNPSRAQPMISGNGQYVAYLAPDNSGVLNVYICAVGQHESKQVTHDAGRGVHYYRWDEDGEHILYLQDSDGDENWHLYRTVSGSSSPDDLTPFPGIRVDFFTTHPDFPNEIVVGLNKRNNNLFDVYRIYLDQRNIVLDTENRGDIIRWTANHKLQIRAALAALSCGGRAVVVRDQVGDLWRTVYVWDGDETFGTILGFNSSDDGLLILSSNGSNTARLIELSLSTLQTRIIASDDNYDVSGCMFHPKTYAIQAVAFLRASQEWLILDDSVRQDFAFFGEQHSGEVFILSRDLLDQFWIIEFLDGDSPADFYVYERNSRRLTMLFCDFPELKHYELTKVKPFSFDASDGMRLHGFLSTPNWLELVNLPLIILVHGGPWARDILRYSPEVQRLTNRGYIVLQVNYRGSSGYGKHYMNAGDKQWGRQMQQDLIDAMDWVIQTGAADPAKVAIYGFSYGGYAALAALTFTPKLFRCGIAAMAPTNLISFLDSIPPYWIPQQAMFKKRVGDVELDREALVAVSPLFHAAQIQSPLLICHGANDPRVRRSESDQFVTTLQTLGRKVDYMVFRDEGHGFYKPLNRFKFFATVEKFLAEHLGGRLEPLSDEEQISPFQFPADTSPLVAETNN